MPQQSSYVMVQEMVLLQEFQSSGGLADNAGPGNIKVSSTNLTG
jgi:hypothetical protein